MALTKDYPRPNKDGKLIAYPVKASTRIYQGGMVCTDSTGLAIKAAAAAGNRFVGVAKEGVDRSASGAAEASVRVESEGNFPFIGTGFSQASVGSVAYATDDETVTTSSGSNRPAVGVITRFVSATEVWVKINVARGL